MWKINAVTLACRLPRNLSLRRQRMRRAVGRTLILLALSLGLGIGGKAAGLGLPLTVPELGEPGFKEVPSTRSGLSFTNELAPAEALKNRNLMNGSGVAAGDFDGDGRCDLYFCAIGGTNKLFRNVGDWRFEEVAEGAGVACPQWRSTGAVFADVDGDGDLDILVSTLGGGVHSFRNGGQGRFVETTAEAGLTSSAGSMSLALGDVDSDGDLDLYVANYGALSVLISGGRAEMKRVDGQWVVTGPHANRLRFIDGRLEEVGEADVLYLNDGTGRFRALPWNSEFFLDRDGKPKPPPADYGLGVQMRDMNGDGAPDIFVCNDFQSPDRLWFNDGQGRFREAAGRAVRKLPFSSMGVDFADLDRDGQLDFLVVEMAGRDHARRMRQVTGAAVQPNVPGRFEFRPQVARNVLYRGNGDGTWSDWTEFAGVAATDWSWQPVFLDVDLDGYEDLLVANGMMYDTQDRDTLARIRALGKQTTEAAHANLLLYPPFASPMAAYRNRGDFTFEDRGSKWGFGAGHIAQGLALADLDGDGDLDFAVNCLNGAALLYRNEASAPRVAVRLAGRPPNTRGIGARIRVLGGPVIQSQEMVSGGRYLSGDDSVRTFATGDAKLLTIEVTWRSGRQTVVSDARPNHRYEIAEADAMPSPAKPPAVTESIFVDRTALLRHAHHEELFDDFVRQPLLPKQLSSLGPGVAWCDLDGDGRDELVIGTGRGGRVQGFRFSPSGQFSSLDSSWIAPDDVVGFTAWTTADGRPALLGAVAHYEVAASNAPPLILISALSGGTNLLITPLLEVSAGMSSPGPLASADYDGDGDLDLFIGGRVIPGQYPRAVGSRLYRREGAGLVLDSPANSLMDQLGLVSGAVWTDLEGDGYPELVLACEWGPVRIFRNRAGKLSAWDPEVVPGPSGPSTGSKPQALSSLTGWWTSVTSGDLDGDGLPDLIVGNWGLNTGNRAQPDRPLRLYYGALGEAGVTDVLESYYPAELTTEMPQRSLAALSQALPRLLERFPSHSAFGQAPMADVLAALPVRPEVVTATTLTTMAFLNRGTQFVASPLPVEAQIASVFGLCVADADGDGHEDVFLAQNFFATRPEWPRADAGLGCWLRGDGQGGFTAWKSGESGVRIFGEQRGAAIGDVDQDGRPDLVVAQNGAETTLWQNRRAHPGLRVRLRGTPGNPCGRGTVARLKFADHVGPAREFHSGAGYWSQESAVQVLATPTPPSTLEIRWPGGRVFTYDLSSVVREVVCHPDGSFKVLR